MSLSVNAVIKGGQAAGMLRLSLESGDTLSIAPGIVVACSTGWQFSERRDGGFLGRIARKFSHGNFLYQEAYATEPDQWICLSPDMPGAVTEIAVYPRMTLIAPVGAFLAATSGVTPGRKIDTHAETALPVVRFTGKGAVFLGAFGAVEILALLPGQSAFVTTAHLLAFEDRILCEKSAEDMIRMTGPGQVWLQTRRLAGEAIQT